MALSAEVGVTTSLDVWTEAGLDGLGFPPSGEPIDAATIPPGLSWVPATKTLDGTPTEAGTWEVALTGADPFGNDAPGTAVVNVTGGSGPDPDPGEPGEVRVVLVEGETVSVDVADRMGVDLAGTTAAPLPTGITYDGEGTLSGTPTAPGSVAVVVKRGDTTVGTVNVLILPAGSSASDDPWDVWDNLAAALAPRVAAIVGRVGDEDTIATAEAQLPLVAEYVRGYTRGRGFDGDAPAGPLRAVIVSATARLATNPEQVSVYTVGDYSERPAQLAGWTLAEIGVLHRYRVVSA